MLKKKILLGALIVVVCILISPTKAQAALQSNGGTPAVYNVNSWITGIRNMQATGGALGLTDTINSTNLTSTNKNLDIHMQKNTEYGALAILSASSYGNPNKIASGETTTGNATGVVMNINKEWVVAVPNNTSATSVANAAGRYKNIYTLTYVAKVGDAITETKGWHGSGMSEWLSSKNGANGMMFAYLSCLLRSYSGSVFSYYGYASDAAGGTESSGFDTDAAYRKTWASRAVVVVGSGV